jgi:hypothetical protein
MECLAVSIARFTYVPDEYYDTIEAAFAAKPLVEWTALVAHSQLTLAIEKTPDKVILKCLDGEDVRVLSSTPSFRTFLEFSLIVY